MILKEIVTPDELVTEIVEENGKKNFYIKGKFFQAELKNGNKRIYPQKLMEREIFKYQNYIKEKSLNAYGELNHPNSINIDLERATHRIVELQTEGNYAVGKAKIIDTPLGNIIKTFIKEGTKLGISSRGTGSLTEKNGVFIVNEDYNLITFDIVNDPSCQNCFVEGLMEGADWVWQSGVWTEKELEELKKKINKNSCSKNKIDENKMLQAFDEFFKNIKI